MISECVRSNSNFHPRNQDVDFGMLEMFFSFQCTKYDENRWLVIAPKKTIGLFCTIVTHSELPNLAFGFISFWQSCKRKGKKQQDARGDNKKGGDRCIEASKEVERL